MWGRHNILAVILDSRELIATHDLLYSVVVYNKAKRKVDALQNVSFVVWENKRTKVSYSVQALSHVDVTF